MAVKQHILLKGSVKPFYFSLGLGMTDRTPGEFDVQFEQPDRQAGQPMQTGGTSPGITMIQQHHLRQAIPLKCRNQCCLNQFGGPTTQGMHAHGKSTMIIKNSQRITTTTQHPVIALEVPAGGGP